VRQRTQSTSRSGYRDNAKSYVHGNTTDNGPAVALGLVLVVGTTGLEQGLVNAATTGNDTDDSTVGGSNDLCGKQQ
jgi:hypothetical protein